ncbi:hypothetical protein HanOQP8_Chr10g0374041 [Helianthus annuus]|nr:hypothetical protein HanOQP8_Chr10g0374041 [Helianthus annuus]
MADAPSSKKAATCMLNLLLVRLPKSNERSFQKSAQTSALTAFISGYGYDESIADVFFNH